MTRRRVNIMDTAPKSPADIEHELLGLHQQATKERSHYYVGNLALRAMEEIHRLRRILEDIETAVDQAKERHT